MLLRERRCVNVAVRTLLCKSGSALSGPFLPHRFHALEHELQAVASPFRASGNVLYIAEDVWIAHFLPQLLQKRMHLGENEKHFAPERVLNKQVFVQQIPGM